MGEEEAVEQIGAKTIDGEESFWLMCRSGRCYRWDDTDDGTLRFTPAAPPDGGGGRVSGDGERMTLARPTSIRARMARRGLCQWQLLPWWGPDVEGDVDPLADEDMRAEVRAFMGELWKACIAAEHPAPPTDREADG